MGRDADGAAGTQIPIQRDEEMFDALILGLRSRQRNRRVVAFELREEHPGAVADAEGHAGKASRRLGGRKVCGRAGASGRTMAGGAQNGVRFSRAAAIIG